MDGIGSWVASVGPEGLLAVAVVAVLTGLLVPRWVHVQRVTDLKEQITVLYAALDKRDEQLSRLASSSELQVRLLQDIKREAAKS